MTYKRTRIHVRRDLIGRDRKTGEISYALGVETLGSPKRFGRRVTIKGPSTVVYQPERPLACGARAWIETHSRVIVHRTA